MVFLINVRVWGGNRFLELAKIIYLYSVVEFTKTLVFYNFFGEIVKCIWDYIISLDFYLKFL